MAKKEVKRVFGTLEEAQAAALEAKRRTFTVNGAYIVAGDVGQALAFAHRAKVPGIEVVQLDALPSIDAALAALVNATPEQKATAMKLLKK
jgi:hypothetical protein